MAAPTLAILVGWVGLQNAWIAIGLYHIQMICWSRSELPRTCRGWNRRTFLTSALPLLATAPVVYVLLPQITSVPVGTWLERYGLEGWQLGAMIPYFGIVHPFLEQAHWGRLRESRFGPFSHVAFAAYHGIVVGSLLPPVWVLASILILITASCLWTYMARQARGGLLVPTLSHIFADLGMVVAAALLVFQPSAAAAQDTQDTEPAREVEFTLELLRSAIAEGDSTIRCQALRVLGENEEDSEEVLHTFREALRDSSVSQGQCVLWGLALRGKRHDDVLPLLREMLDGQNVDLIRRTIATLSDLGQTWPVCEELADALLDPRAQVRAAAANRILPKNCEKEFALPLLAQSLLDDDGSVRKAAASAIAAYRADATMIVDELMAALDDPNFNVQITIVRALGTIGPPAAASLPMLREIPAHGFAKDILDTAIAKISGEAPPPKQQTAP